MIASVPDPDDKIQVGDMKVTTFRPLLANGERAPAVVYCFRFSVEIPGQSHRDLGTFALHMKPSSESKYLVGRDNPNVWTISSFEEGCEIVDMKAQNPFLAIVNGSATIGANVEELEASLRRFREMRRRKEMSE